MFNEKVLSQILEIFYNNNRNYCIESQNGKCIDFMRYLGYFLYKKNQNFEFGELQSVEKNGKVNQCTHMFIKYKNLYFDSIRFGEETLNTMKDYFKSDNGYYIVYKNKDYYIVNKETKEIDDNYSFLYETFLEIEKNLN